MKFEYSERVPYPQSQVYRVLRDQLDELARYIPNVDGIEVLEREELEGGRLRVINRWQGSASTVPAALRPFVTQETTAWKDHACWIDAEHRVEYWFETFQFDKLYHCEGINYVEADGDDASVVRITGELQLYPERLPGVPRLIAKRIAPKVEAFVIKLITPNLRQMPAALKVFLDAGEGKG